MFQVDYLKKLREQFYYDGCFTDEWSFKQSFHSW